MSGWLKETLGWLVLVLIALRLNYVGKVYVLRIRDWWSDR